MFWKMCQCWIFVCNTYVYTQLKYISEISYVRTWCEVVSYVESAHSFVSKKNTFTIT